MGKATNFKFCMHILSIDRNKSPLQISGNVAGCVVRTLETFQAPIYWAHRAVFFVIAQLSCYDYRCKVFKDNFTELPDKLHKNRYCFLHVDNVNGYCSHVSYSSLQYLHYLQIVILLNLHRESFYAQILGGLDSYIESPPWKSKTVSSPAGLWDRLQPKSNMPHANMLHFSLN